MDNKKERLGKTASSSTARMAQPRATTIEATSQSSTDRTLETCLNTLKSLSTEAHPKLATCMLKVGNIYRDRHDYNHALEYTLKALDCYEKCLPENHPQIALCLNEIGGIYDSLTDYNRSFEYYERAIKIYNKICPNTRFQKGKLMGNNVPRTTK
ncbi:unnamed protein product [Didymodactylos carnosus]|uniref:Kinesin light chain n=1 Tax=Didymodactylos carnosus TaxID=1234261 RepID=A0A814D8H7_9BILA|nr:unnamed protein product [Didymodactylos carnosus]CAF1577185.1 unnamed protein product [Didymodactylos carnosus]CAF3729058.1 unnamed protein product [Didymodactylos carnosus]CAF4374777.1 unnamed protein product [Didymodactylos carnosus]